MGERQARQIAGQNTAVRSDQQDRSRMLRERPVLDQAGHELGLIDGGLEHLLDRFGD